MSENKFDEVLEKIETAIKENKVKRDFVQKLKGVVSKAEKHLKKSDKEK